MSLNIILIINILVLIIFCEKCKSVILNNDIPNNLQTLVSTLSKVEHMYTMYIANPVKDGQSINKLENDSNLVFSLNWHLRTLRCTYIFNILQHMRLTRYLFSININNDKRILLINKYKNIIREMIAMAYAVGVRELNGLWLPFIYMDKLANMSPIDPSLTSNVNMENGKKKLHWLLIHTAIQNRLEKLTGKKYCRDNNLYSFNTKNYNIEECTNEINQDVCLKKVEEEISINFCLIQNTMKRNTENGILPKNLEWFTPERLYLNDIAKSKSFMKDIIEAFHVGIDWSAFLEMFTKQLEKSKKFESLKDGSRHISDYQLMFLNMIKLIVIRMTRKYLVHQFKERLSLVNILQNNNNRKANQTRYTDNIIEILEKFIIFFNFQKNEELNLVHESLVQFTKEGLLKRSWIKIFSSIRNIEKKLIEHHFPNNLLVVSKLSLDKEDSATLIQVEGLAKKHGMDLSPLQERISVNFNLRKINIFYYLLNKKSELENINYGIITSFRLSQEYYILSW